ncbi:uncharacterized protein LOC142618783 [Castanea sativa]|uniref:uncharacterized protein LOC142618783 n=1 Tax=Castanea sativa TaxID=21020 RepID=UPI003F65321C
MRILLQGKAFGENIQGMDGLEEKVSEFFGEDGNDSNPTLEDQHDGYEFDGNDSHDDPVERNLYWETQEVLLQEILENYSLTASRLRQELSRIIELAKESDYCKCSKPSFDGCIHCLRRGVVTLLCEKGFRASLCTSRWRHTKKFPGGSHEYIEVIASTASRKKQISFLIELEFRDQFKIAKACDEYHKLSSQLPEYYIGKPDYLNAIVRVVCDAAKKSMKEKKIHMGPWRKRSFMQMKWSGSSDRSSSPDDESINKLSTLSSRQASESRLHVNASPAVVVT